MGGDQERGIGPAGADSEAPENKGLSLADAEVNASVREASGEICFADVEVNAPVKKPPELGEMALADADINAPAELDHLLEALKAGAADHLLRDDSRRELIEALEQALCGEAPPSPEFADRLGALLRPLMGGDQNPEKPPPKLLTPRELEVLQHLARGLTNRQIAQKLVLSAGTVRIHVQHIIAKLDVSDRTQAAVKASRLGLL